MHSKLVLRKQDVMLHWTSNTLSTFSLQVLIITETPAVKLDFLQLVEVAIASELVIRLEVWVVKPEAVHVEEDSAGGSDCLHEQVSVIWAAD